MRMTDAFDDAPRLFPPVDVASPCQRFEANAQFAPGRALGEFVQLGHR